jgi:hypothetical protein
MKLPAGNGYTVHLEEINGLGSTWIVRVRKNFLMFHTTVSSDWFLDGAQATRFAEQLALELRSGRDAEEIEGRKPGWTLHRPPQRSTP